MEDRIVVGGYTKHWVANNGRNMCQFIELGMVNLTHVVVSQAIREPPESSNFEVPNSEKPSYIKDCHWVDGKICRKPD